MSIEDRFKFRAWNGQDREYDYNAQNISFYDRDEDSITLFRHVERDKPDVILEQCTGLKDRNGKLIYEGDIVLLSDNNKNYQVFFDEETGQFKVKMPYMSGYEVLNFEIYQPSSSLFTVVGNIHENPELLEK